MEQAYGAVSQTIVRLASGTGEDIDHATNQAILRSTLHQRPVALGYALTTFAKRLREDGQPSQDSAGAATAASAEARVPHIGIRLALEVLLGSSYDPSTPHAVESVVDALGEGRLEALLHAPGEAAPLLPWAARLCLLHACLSAGTAGARRWSWLPAVANSASSLGLQEIATNGGIDAGGGAVSSGKGRARAPPRNKTGTHAAVITGRTEAFSAALMVQVCEELAGAGLSRPDLASRSSFLSTFRRDAAGVAGSGLSSGCAAGLLPGGHVEASFRLKLRSLRDALLCGTEQDEAATEQPMPTAAAAATSGVGLEDLEIHPHTVRRALERGRCGGEAFILAVQAVLERSVSPGGTSDAIAPRDSSHRALVKLRHALDACLFGSGLLEGRGLLDAVAVDDRATSFVPPEARQACALMQGLVEEGARIRDLVLTLLDMHQEREGRRSPARPPASSVGDHVPCRRTGADVVATVRPACDCVRRPLAGVLRAFVGWLADTPWVWGATEGVEGEDFEGDFAAAASAISAVYPAPLAVAGGAETGVFAASSIQTEWGSSLGPGDEDPTDVLDRLVAGAAMAMGHADASNIEWIAVLQRVASAAAATDSLRAYAVACVEKSAALGGQAPFGVARMGKRRFCQVRGKELWGLLEGLLEGAYGLRGGSLAGEQAPTAVLIRAAATTAIIASRKMSHSWMISPGLLGSGPLRTVIDMLTSANGRVTASDVLGGLLERPGGEGPALAADFFAALVAAASAVASEEVDRGDNERTGLLSQTTAWLRGALSASPLPPAAHPPGGLSVRAHSTITATALARHLIRRVPFEAKPVLLAVQEATELAAAGRGGLGAGSSSTRRTGERMHVSWSGEGPGSAGLEAVAPLLKAARAAVQSPLLPLPVPGSLTPLHSDGSESGGTLDSRALLVDGDSGGSMAGEHGGKVADVSSASVTAEMVLGTFVRSPAAVRRSIREAMRDGKCDDELRAMQAALRRALCTAPRPAGQDSGPAAAAADSDPRDRGGPISTPLSAGLGARKAPACLLAGFLVESGVPGWEDTKAAMTPPPHQLLEAAEEDPVSGAPLLGQQQRPLTALRLEVWLRSLLCDADSGSRFDAGSDIDKSFPDVFRTARTMARAIARHASSLVHFVHFADAAGRGPGVMPLLIGNGYHPAYPGSGSGVPGLLRPYSAIGADGGEGGGNWRKEPGVVQRLEPARGALAGRLEGVPAAETLISWVSSVVKTAKQYQRWLPWQAFADELRELVLQIVRQQAEGYDGAAGGGGGTGRTLAAEAGIFAVCELLLAWVDTDEEVIAAVFQPALSSRALGTVVAPVTHDVRPPIWLEVLRCLCDSSSWSSPQAGGGVPEDLLAVAAAAAVWIGGDGPGKGLSGDRSAREAWMHWYGAKLDPLIPRSDADLREWLVLSSTTGGGMADGGVYVRTGMAGAARSVKPREWENWGRSPLQAAWNFPGEWREQNASAAASGIDAQQAPPAIVLPPFASWLRVVLRGGPSCPDGLLEAYLRRMAREVYLPCQFNGASGEMARQWLGTLIEAEVGADGRAKSDATTGRGGGNGGGGDGVGTVSNGGNAMKADFSSEGGAGSSSARRLVVRAFFREELLRFGSGEASAAAPVGGPLTWLWPLEAVVAACGKAGPFSGNVLARRRRSGGCTPQERQHAGDAANAATAAATRIILGDPPSALARALGTVPHDLLCGARRFDRGGGQPPPAVATLKAFAMRAVDLTARALATPPCRHWSVARRLLLGLGLLYHALAKPGPVRDGNGSTRAKGGSGAADSQASAQGAALFAIETLVRTALGLRDDGAGAGAGTGAALNGSSAARVARGSSTGPAGSPGGAPLLTSACLALRPLETGTRAGAVDLAEALRGAGAWRAAASFFGAPKPSATQHQTRAAATVAEPPAEAQPARSLPPSPPPPPPLSPANNSQPHHRYSSPGAIPAEDLGRPVGGYRANGRSIADALIGGETPGSAGGHEVDADSPRSPSWRCPTSQQQVTPSRSRKKARVGDNNHPVEAERKPPPSSPRRVLPRRLSTRLHDGGGS
eukprot:g13499.t1